MTSPNILREYLVALGWKIDEQQFKTFNNRLAASANQFKEFGKVAAASAAVIGEVVLKVAANMEDLYFAAQKAGTSVTALRGIRFAAEQVGLGAENATAHIQAMATALRTNPGLHLFFQNLGIKEVADNTENFIALLEKLRGLSAQGPMQHAIATQIAGMFGMDEQTLTLFEKNLPELIKAQQDAKAALTKTGANDLQATQFHQFMEDVRKLEQSVQLLVTAFGGHLLPVAERIVKAMQEAVDYAIELDKRTGGKSTVAGGTVAAVVSALGGIKALRWLRGFFGGAGAAEVATGAAATATESTGAGPLALGIGAGIVGIDAALGGPSEEARSRKLKSMYDVLLHDNAAATNEDLIKQNENERLRPYPDAGGFSVGFGHRIQQGEDFSGGVTHEGALKLLAQDISTAITAITKLVKVHLGANQMKALTDFVYNVGVGAFAQSDLLKKLNSGDFTGAAGEFSKWDKSRLNGVLTQNDALVTRRLGEQKLFNTPDVKMEQNTTIHVTGDDAASTGKAVAKEQSRVNGDMLRNLQGAMQ